MKKPEEQRPFLHAAKMLRRNLKSYGMLSVTIILSFCLLLAYMILVDSNLYNQYKAIFSAPREIVMAYQWKYKGAETGEEYYQLKAAAQKADPTVQSYSYFGYSSRMVQYGSNLIAQLYFLPSGEHPVYNLVFYPSGNFALPVELVSGEKLTRLGKNQAVVNESFFRALCPEGELPVALSIPLMDENEVTTMLSVQVVGVCSDIFSDYEVHWGEDGRAEGICSIFLSQEVLNDLSQENLFIGQSIYWFCTEEPEALAEFASGMNSEMVVHAACKAQDAALIQIRAQTAAKGNFTIMLLILLGINLYSSFSNALNDRKYEIGIKRALGASPGQIVRQFLTESLLLMGINILLSVVLVTEGLALYKLYRFLALGEQWTVWMSPYSAGAFAICSITLTVVFSVLFAWQSTQVEIVRYLKGE